MLVDGGIPNANVHTVHNSDQASRAFSEHTVETVAQLRGLNFSSVSRADGRQPVRKDDAGLEKAELAKVFELAGVEETPVEPGEGPGAGREEALVRDIVNAEEGPDVVVGRL